MSLHELSSMHELSERDRENFLVSLLTKSVKYDRDTNIQNNAPFLILDAYFQFVNHVCESGERFGSWERRGVRLWWDLGER